MKKIVVMLLIVLATSFIATAQVPKPPTGENNDTKGRGGAVRTKAVNSGPIGTATTLLLSLGVGAIAYKVRKSNSNRK